MAIDSVLASKVSAAAGVAVPPGGWVIDHIRWYNPAAANDTFVLTLGDGTTVFLKDICVTAHQSIDYPMYGLKIEDFQIPTLASGVLYVYFR